MKLQNTLVALLALSLASACVPEPPGGDGNNNNDTNNEEGCTSDAQCSGSTPICEAGSCVADDTPECTSDAECSGDTPICEAETCVAAPEACEVNTDYVGQIGGDEEHLGGVFTNDATASTYEADAGLQAIFDFISAKVDDGTIVEDSEDTADVREDELTLEAGSELQVTGAVITSMRFSTGNGSTIQDNQDRKSVV